MSSTNGIMNMGFPEFPDDAFDVFDSPPLPVLRRTFRASCQYCGKRSETMDRENRVFPCLRCMYHNIPLIQSVVRGFLVRQSVKRLRNKEIINRWLMTGGCNGNDLSWYMSSFF